MKHVYLLLCSVLVSLAGFSADPVPLPRFPSISPDGNTIVFSWAGDLWKVPVKGGEAVPLTDLQGDAFRSVWSKDGKLIAFSSSHMGSPNVFVMNADGSNIRQLTWTDRNVVVTGFCKDAQGRPAVTFSSTLECDPFDDQRLYCVPLQGGDPQRLHDAFGDWPVVSPDDKHLLFSRGLASWQRRHQQTGPTRDVFLFDRAAQKFQKLTSHPGNDGQPRWISNNEFVYISGRDGRAGNLFLQKLGKAENEARQLTRFTANDVLSFDVTANGKAAILHVWDKLYALDLRNDNAEPKPIEITVSVRPQPSIQTRGIENSVTDAALSPDGNVMACIAFNEVFVRDMQNKSATVRVTDSPGRKRGVVWSPDGLKLYFASDETGREQIYAATVALTRGDVLKQNRIQEDTSRKSEPENEKPKEPEKNADGSLDKSNDKPTDKEKAEKSEKGGDGKEAKEGEPASVKTLTPPPQNAENARNPQRWKDAIKFDLKPVFTSQHNDSTPSPSPDGRSLAFCRNFGQLMILDLASGNARLLRDGSDPRINWSWSYDSAWLAFDQQDYDDNRDVWIMPVDGSVPPVNVSQHPGRDYGPSWSADGKILSFISSRINGQNDIWSLNLDRAMDRYSPREWTDYFRNTNNALKRLKPLPVAAATSVEAAPAKKAVPPVDLSDAYLRLRRVTNSPASEFGLVLLPAGDRYVFRGGDGTYTVKWDGSELRKLNVNGAPVSLSVQGDRIVTLENGRIAVSAIASGEVTWVDVSHRLRIHQGVLYLQMFREAARVLEYQFYHPTMKNLEWARLTERYAGLAAQAQTASEFSEISNRFLGELNASHMGLRTPSRAVPNAQSQAQLGVSFQRSAKGYEITSILPDGPADLAKLAKGDVIVSVEDTPFVETESLAERLEGKVGKEILLGIQRQEQSHARTFNVLITPVASGTIQELRYTQWWKQCSERVKEWSKGKLGYGHIRQMNESSLDVFERDLYAAAHGREGLIIDVRNNHGGYITDRILASLLAPNHAYTLPRGSSPTETSYYPRGYLYIQRYVLPINALCNGQSGSNAEIFSHAIKTMKRGTLIGEPTQGAVISTGEYTLLDGSTVRMPTRGWFLPDGSDMENTPAVPDILVVQTPESEVAGEDPQLRAAVDDLLKRLGNGNQMKPPRYDMSVSQPEKNAEN